MRRWDGILEREKGREEGLEDGRGGEYWEGIDQNRRRRVEYII